MSESALYHGKQSLKYCKKNEIGGLDLTFGYEALARAYMVEKNQDLMEKNIQLAKQAADMIEDEQNKHYILLELKTISF